MSLPLLLAGLGLAAAAEPPPPASPSDASPPDTTAVRAPAAPADAAVPEVHPGWHYTAQAAVANWPTGVQVYVDPEYRLPLWAKRQDNLLFAGSALSFVTHLEATPSFPRVGLGLRFAPLALWEGMVRLDGVVYPGAFSSLFPLPSPDTAATAEWRRDAGQGGLREGGVGMRLLLNQKLKLKVGPVVAMLELEARHHDLWGFRGDLAWTWEPTDMLTVASHGWTVHRNAYLLGVLHDEGQITDPPYLWVGAYGQWISAPATGDENVRLGPVAAFRTGAKPGVPTVFVGSQAWLRSRFRDTLPPYTFVATQWSR